MRFATPVLALVAAALIAACGSVAAPKLDPAGDAAFLTQLRQLCSKTPALSQIAASANMATITTAATADNTTVTDFDAGLGKLTPTISSTSPLASTVTDLAFMLLDTSKWYVNILNAVKSGDKSALSWMPQLAATRATQARSDLTKIGITSCLS